MKEPPVSSNEHRCQRYQGLWQQDPEFPRTYQTNAWCWTPELGFHRAKTPDQPLSVRIRNTGRRVGPDHMWTWQAMRLGMGEGTASGGGTEQHLSPVFERALEVMWSYRGDADPIALYGHRCRGLSDALDANDRVRRAVYTDALLRILPAGLDHVDALLLDLAHSSPSPGAQRTDPIANPSSEAESWLNTLHHSLAGERTCHGAMRTIGRIFISTGPNEGQRVQWLMDTVRSARARLAEHTNTALP